MSTLTEDQFRIGASPTIGMYVLPGEVIDSIHHTVKRKIELIIAPCDEIIKAIKKKKLDLGFIESPIFDDALIYREWMEDEMVLCSKKKLDPSLNKKNLASCRIICREKASVSRAFIEDFFKQQNISYQDFNAISEVDNTTAIIQSIKWSKPQNPITAVAMVSKISIEYELKYNDLYASKINNTPLIRKFYILYEKDSKQNSIIEEICDELLAEKVHL